MLRRDILVILSMLTDDQEKTSWTNTYYCFETITHPQITDKERCRRHHVCLQEVCNSVHRLPMIPSEQMFYQDTVVTVADLPMDTILSNPLSQINPSFIRLLYHESPGHRQPDGRLESRHGSPAHVGLYYLQRRKRWAQQLTQI